MTVVRKQELQKETSQQLLDAVKHAGFGTLKHMTHVNNLENILKYGLQSHGNSPDGIRLRGLYSREDNTIELNLAVLRGSESFGKVEMEMHVDELSDWQGKLLEIVLGKLALKVP
jgi:hypothetical protein